LTWIEKRVKRLGFPPEVLEMVEPSEITSWISYFTSRLITLEGEHLSFAKLANRLVEIGVDVSYSVHIEDGRQLSVCVYCGNKIIGKVPTGYLVESTGIKDVFFYTICQRCGDRLDLKIENVSHKEIIDRLKRAVKTDFPTVKIKSNRREDPFKLLMGWALKIQEKRKLEKDSKKLKKIETFITLLKEYLKLIDSVKKAKALVRTKS